MNPSIPTRPRRTLAAPALLAVLAGLAAPSHLLPAQGATPTVFYACYVPSSGVVYRIKEPGLAQACATKGPAQHIEFSWTDGPSGHDHGALNGLADDDHPQYLLASGLRALLGNLSAGDFKVTNLAAATANGDAVRYEQAVKSGDAAGGDLSGSFPNPGVAKLQGKAVSATDPADGQVLKWNAAASTWEPATLMSVINDHGALSGLTDDDHAQYLLANGVRSAPNGFAVTGIVGSGSIPASGGGTRFMWYPRKAAIRAGSASGTEWDDASVGQGSVAFGLQPIASGIGAIALGQSTRATGQFSVALGGGSFATASSAVAIGSSVHATAFGAFALGRLSQATGNDAFALGVSATATQTGAVAIGNGADATAGHAFALGAGSTASGQSAVALGANTVSSGTGSFATGILTTASGDVSTAMGRLASTNGMDGSFVYGDLSTTSVVNATNANQFMVRAAGGTIFYSNPALTAGVSLSPGGGAWNTVSDVKRKENFRDVDGETVLRKIGGMPIREWNYRSQDASVRHLGPTAQDFFAAFGLGGSDTTITTIDADGVSLLAIQALERRTTELRDALRELDTLRDDLAALRDELRSLRAAEVSGRSSTALTKTGGGGR